MAAVAIFPHQFRPQALELAERAIAWLEARGHEVRLPEEEGRFLGFGGYCWPRDKLVEGLELAVSLGGDGTMLHTVDQVADAGVPVLGVNVGNLGYLTEVEPADLESALDRFFAGNCQLQARMTLAVAVEGPDGGLARTALNEAVLQKTASGHTVRLAIEVNGQPFFTCAADGFIIATPTGSTAYNFSARGPVVSPRHRAIVLTPVSPHTLFDRSVVLNSDDSVRLEVLEHRAAELVVDGANLGPLSPGHSVTCSAGAHDARFVSFGGRDFHQILKDKFKLADG
ncbi:MAG TPA: NAD(+)/NADH kinase [Acidimicrobiales bacterium]|nr:NAD(+)/NADH kinase [Acidimicrobiales bacterium]